MQQFNRLINFLRNNTGLSLVIFLLLLGRLSISGQGYLEDSDEVDYYCAEDAFDALVELRLSDFSHHVSLTEGKPTETLFKVAQVPLHRLWAWIVSEPIHSPSGLWILGFINILVSLGLLLVYYQFLLALGLHKGTAMVAVAALGILINFNLYTRHLLSYDTGLLLPMLSLLVLVKSKGEGEKQLRLAGFLAALGFTSYHGHFMMYAIIGIWVLFIPASKEFDSRKRLVALSKGFFPLLCVYEVFFWVGGHSFFLELLKIGVNIGQGSYEEGFIYAPLYLANVEGAFGVGLFALMIISVGFAVKEKAYLPPQRLLLIAVGAYLLYGFAVYFLHAFVFYGRVLHLYLPFMVMGAVMLFERWKFTRSMWFQGFLYSLLAVQYLFNIENMNSFTYPRKVLALYSLTYEHLNSPAKHFFYELKYSENYIANHRFTKHGISATTNTTNPFFYLNTCFFHHHPDRFISTYTPFNAGNKRAIFEGLHFMSHPAYTFEYCSSVGRKFYLSRKFKIAVYKP